MNIKVYLIKKWQKKKWSLNNTRDLKMNLLSYQGDQNIQSDQLGRHWDTEKHKSLFEVMEKPCHQGASLMFTQQEHAQNKT